jgi:DNA-binding MarR family transcriptional regulator
MFTDAIRRWSEVFLGRTMHDLYRYVKAADLTMPQFSLLMRLYRGDHGDRCGVTDVGAHLGITNAAASQLVDKLVNQGLVARTEDARDRRVRRLALTPPGRRLVEGSVDARLAWAAGLAEALPAERCAEVAEALEALVAAAERLSVKSEA